MEYELIRSDRKTIGISVTRDARVVVRAPKRVPKREIDRFLAEKQAWVKRHMEAMLRKKAERDAFAPDYGGRAPLNGKEYPITATDGRLGFDGERFLVPAGYDPAQVRQWMAQIYRMVAKRVLPERTAYYAGRMGVAPANVRVNAARKRWGSCSSKNSVNYSWRLILAPDEAIDYVVVHELAHITEHNHSCRFWRIVEGVLPDYRQRRKLLEALQERLNIEDW